MIEENSYDTRATQQYFLILALEYAFMYVYLIEEAVCVAGMLFLLVVR